MRKYTTFLIGFLATAAIMPNNGSLAASKVNDADLRRIVDETVRPLMTEQKIPGMAVAITIDGKSHFFGYGVASKESGQKVTEETIFEIGSISKTFTAMLGGYGLATGAFSLSDPAIKWGPELTGSSFDKITMLDLGTYTPGGLPLQFPDTVSDDKSMLSYFKDWKPDYPASTQRRYSNPSIGLFGYLAARSMDKPFDVLMEETLLPAFGLKNTFINVPESQMKNYAYGYSKANKPIRVSGGALDAQAYGIKTTALDLARFVELNIDSSSLKPDFQKAVAATHTGYYHVGANNQGLGWEFYTYPTALKTLLAGNSSDMALKSHRIKKFDQPLQLSADVLINKTGSTNGFGAYAAFIPAKKTGIVLLANRNYPIDERVKAAYRIIQALDKKQ
ncbi:OCH family extended-spectrum class C beta-lactamase [Brucella cytisi]|uniref:Beta-lactamase n=1 Tax=Brucella cytisi TaxID=407152 RepID=A0A1J6HMV1_9HYPH|nr:OCH family extended-spectrum class C beta-lactamase [Brucella cytisi]OIS93777.1 class C beta-lactamase [Brucella cytisi]